MKFSYKTIFSVTVAVLTTIAMVSCKDTEYPTPVPATAASTLTSRVLFVNAAPGTTLNFFTNNLPAGTNVALGANTAYNTVTVGPLQLRAKAASGTIGGILGSNDILFRAGATNQNNFTAASGINYTFFVTDTLNRARSTAIGATDPGGPRFLNVTDNLATPAAGNAHIRFFHLAPNAPAVWVNVLRTGVTAPVASFANRAYRAVSTGTGATAVNFANFSPLTAGTYTVEVRTGSATGPVALTVPNVTLADGKIYTLYARGLAGGTGANALGAGVVLHN
ncbi:DUF4397 domain-containing protein [Runella slithyformis]|uniref:DUF4397 domain-containing protein n=1 Tax=Runella slithyformis (strain ATCC 29530 / DSM 19594 / LMG 11500 / NCIMB 11436 / LSU 4) TaxID=761193 RepID=A0A7U3ZR43_RUNSL|nr:DUF4397 domain-containing protein [Runella slithyformis]AEI51822.1 hypothetical protein Runsl_5532 [Runella slithyformis DSM 19594]